MTRLNWSAMLVAVTLALGAYAWAEQQAPKTVSGKVSCGGCAGVAEKCSVMLTDKDGARWVLLGDSEAMKKAFKDRHSDKTLTATLAGEPVAKKTKDGKEYKEAKVADIKAAQ